MKKLVCSALALPLTAGVGWASDDDWANLDRMAEELAASLDNHDGGPKVGGFVIANYWYSSDIGVDNPNDPPNQNDLGGFDVPHARIHVSGNRSDWEYFVEYNFATNVLLDAFIRLPITGTVYAKVGQQRPPVLHNSHVYRPNLFFTERSAAGQIFAARDRGLLVGGNVDVIDWYLSVLNGSDGTGDDYFLTVRAEAKVMGDGIGLIEGAQGGRDLPQATAGVALWTDNGIKDFNDMVDDGIAFDFHVATNVYSVGIEVLDLGGDDGGTGDPIDVLGSSSTGRGTPLSLRLEGESNPITVQATYMVIPEELEVGARYTKSDNSDDDQGVELALRKYFDGHRANVGLFYRRVESDLRVAGADVNDFDLFGVDLVVAF